MFSHLHVQPWWLALNRKRLIKPTWRAEWVSRVEVWKQHSLFGHLVQVWSFFVGFSKHTQVSPAHLHKTQENRLLFIQFYLHMCTSALHIIWTKIQLYKVKLTRGFAHLKHISFINRLWSCNMQFMKMKFWVWSFSYIYKLKNSFLG